jgi:hypothetical protein
MDLNKYNTSLSCSDHPFGYIEQRTEINTKNCGKIAVISFGAMEFHSRYAPELGGVAILHIDPNLFIAVRYIPWDAKARQAEHDRCVEHITKSDGETPRDFAFFFQDEMKYRIPAVNKRWEREYQEYKQERIENKKAGKLARDDWDPRFDDEESLEEYQANWDKEHKQSVEAPKKTAAEKKPEKKVQQESSSFYKGEELINLE